MKTSFENAIVEISCLCASLLLLFFNTQISGSILVDRPTQLICISDIYLFQTNIFCSPWVKRWDATPLGKADFTREQNLDEQSFHFEPSFYLSRMWRADFYSGKMWSCGVSANFSASPSAFLMARFAELPL